MEGSSLNHLFRIFLIALSVTFCIHSISATRPTPKTTNTEFIKTSCSCTIYPKLCYSSLADKSSSIQTSPKLMAHAALNVTLAMTKSTCAIMLKLSKGSRMQPREVEAMQDCLEELSDSVDELRRSMGEMGVIKSSNYEAIMSDVQTWVSAALTDEGTCSDGFQANTQNGKAVRGKILNIAHMTSNALALINNYASLHG